MVNPSEAPGSASPSMVSRQANRVPGASGIGPRLTARATSMGEPSGIPWGWLTVNSPRTSTGWVPSAVSIITGRPSASSKKSSQWCDVSASCQSTSIFKRHGGGHRVGAGHAPPAPQDVELAVGDLGGVAEQHRHFHGKGGYRAAKVGR